MQTSDAQVLTAHIGHFQAFKLTNLWGCPFGGGTLLPPGLQEFVYKGHVVVTTYNKSISSLWAALDNKKTPGCSRVCCENWSRWSTLFGLKQLVHYRKVVPNSKSSFCFMATLVRGGRKENVTDENIHIWRNGLTPILVHGLHSTI